MEIYLWTEDSKSGFDFWKLISDTLYAGKIHVESKGNCSNLLKAVSKLDNTSDIYLIAFDDSFDNTELHRTTTRIKSIAKNRQNVKLLKMVCFEYVLLTFSNLGTWVFKNRPDILHNPKSLAARTEMLKVKDKLLSLNRNGTSSAGDYKRVDIIRDYYTKHINGNKPIESSNIEQFSSKLLHQILRNTGFEIKKGTLGPCWKTDCPDGTQICEFCSMYETACEFCGSDYTVYDKLEEVFENSDLKRILDIDELKPYRVTLYELNANYVLYRLNKEGAHNVKSLPD